MEMALEAGQAYLRGNSPQKLKQTLEELTDEDGLLAVGTISLFLQGDLDDTFPFFPVLEPSSKSSLPFMLTPKNTFHNAHFLKDH